VLLDGGHQRLVVELGQLAAGPVAVVGLAEAVVDVLDQAGAGGEERGRGLPAAFEGAADDGGEGDAVEPLGQAGGLGGAVFVEAAALAVERPCRTRISVGMPTA
jgi:hypothetical protein